MRLGLGAVLLLTARVWAQDCFLGGPAIPWRPLQALREGQTITVQIPPDGAPAPAWVVTSKPDWMVLDDVTAPSLRSVSLNGNLIPPDKVLHLTAAAPAPRIEVTVSDEANPVDVNSICFWLEGRRLAPEATPFQGGQLTAAFDLSEIPIGAHEGRLEVRDQAPAANLLRVPVHLSVNGIRRHDDGQTVSLVVAGYEYIVGGEGRGQGFVRFGANGPAAYLTTQVDDKFVYARRVIAIEDFPDRTGVRLTTDVIGIEDQDFGQIARLEFDIATLPEFPGILVTSRARNLGPTATVYCFWGWLPGKGFITPAGRQAWSMTYRDIGKVGWVFLPPTEPGAAGIGVLSSLPFGESRFGTLLVYTDPQRIQTPTGEAVEMKLGFMLADDADQVSKAYANLERAAWLTTP